MHPAVYVVAEAAIFLFVLVTATCTAKIGQTAALRSSSWFPPLSVSLQYWLSQSQNLNQSQYHMRLNDDSGGGVPPIHVGGFGRFSFLVFVLKLVQVRRGNLLFRLFACCVGSRLLGPAKLHVLLLLSIPRYINNSHSSR